MNTSVTEAAKALELGGIVAYPTEAVFGLGCDPQNATAIERLLALKGREASKGLILVAANQAQLTPYLGTIQPRWQQRMDEAWPGPVTFIAPASPSLPAQLNGNRQSIAVRVSNHPIVKALCLAFGSPVVSTSANLSGEPPARTANEVLTAFANSLDAVIDAPTGTLGAPTTIIDLPTGQRLR